VPPCNVSISHFAPSSYPSQLRLYLPTLLSPDCLSHTAIVPCFTMFIVLAFALVLFVRFFILKIGYFTLSPPNSSTLYPSPLVDGFCWLLLSTIRTIHVFAYPTQPLSRLKCYSSAPVHRFVPPRSHIVYFGRTWNPLNEFILVSTSHSLPDIPYHCFPLNHNHARSLIVSLTSTPVSIDVSATIFSLFFLVLSVCHSLETLI